MYKNKLKYLKLIIEGLLNDLTVEEKYYNSEGKLVYGWSKFSGSLVGTENFHLRINHNGWRSYETLEEFREDFPDVKEIIRCLNFERFDAMHNDLLHPVGRVIGENLYEYIFKKAEAEQEKRTCNVCAGEFEVYHPMTGICPDCLKTYGEEKEEVFYPKSKAEFLERVKPGDEIHVINTGMETKGKRGIFKELIDTEYSWFKCILDVDEWNLYFYDKNNKVKVTIHKKAEQETLGKIFNTIDESVLDRADPVNYCPDNPYVTHEDIDVNAHTEYTLTGVIEKFVTDSDYKWLVASAVGNRMLRHDESEPFDMAYQYDGEYVPFEIIDKQTAMQLDKAFLRKHKITAMFKRDDGRVTLLQNSN